MSSQRRARTEQSGGTAGSSVAPRTAELYTLGHVQLVLQGTDETPKLGPKHLALLVYLFHEQRPMQPSEVIELLGHGQDEETEVESLKRSVAWLAKCVPGINIRLTADTIEAFGGLRLDTRDVDYAIDNADARVVAERYQGEFLEDFDSGAPGFNEWAQRERGRLKRAWSQAMVAAARKAERQGRWQDAALWWQNLVGRAPMRHELVAGLIRAHVKSHELEQAGQVYANYCARLEENGIARPASSVQRLVVENPAITRIHAAIKRRPTSQETQEPTNGPRPTQQDDGGNGAVAPPGGSAEPQGGRLPDFDLIEETVAQQRPPNNTSTEPGLLGLWEQFRESDGSNAEVRNDFGKGNGDFERTPGSRLEFFLPDGGSEFAEAVDEPPARPLARDQFGNQVELPQERPRKDRYTRISHQVTSVRKPWGPYLKRTWDELEPLREYMAELALEGLKWTWKALLVALRYSLIGLVASGRALGRGFRSLLRGSGAAGRGLISAGRGFGSLGRGVVRLLATPFVALGRVTLVGLRTLRGARRKSRKRSVKRPPPTKSVAPTRATVLPPTTDNVRDPVAPAAREKAIDEPVETSHTPPPLSAGEPERLARLSFEEFGGPPPGASEETIEETISTPMSPPTPSQEERNGAGRAAARSADDVFSYQPRPSIETWTPAHSIGRRTGRSRRRNLALALKALQRRWYAPVGLGAGGVAVVLALIVTGVIGGGESDLPGKLTSSLPKVNLPKVTVPKVTVPKVTVKTPTFIENPLSTVGELFSGSILKENGEWVLLADVTTRGVDDGGDLAAAATVALEAYLTQARFFSVVPRERALRALGQANGVAAEGLDFETALKAAGTQGIPVVISAEIGRGANTPDSLRLSVHNPGGKELYGVRAVVEEGMTTVEALVGLAGPLRGRLGEPSEEVETASAPAQLLSSSTDALTAYARARSHLAAGRYAAAITAGRQATTHDSAFALAYRITAEAYALNGQRPAARSALEAAWELSEGISERERLRLLADRLAWDGNNEDAALTYDRLFQLYRDDVGALRSLAVMQRKIGARGGEGNLRVAYTIDPYDWPALSRVARYLGYAGSLPDVDSLVASLATAQ